jgi:nitrite reductase (NADH) large subunit
LAGLENFEILLGRELKEITSDGVVLADQTVDCDCVVFSVGSSAVILDCSNLNISRGIEVDSGMRTNLPDIFAAGDAALFGGVPCGLFTTASQMGQVAGCCAAGGEAEFILKSNPVRLNALGLKLFSAGRIDEALKNELQVSPGGFSRTFFNNDGKMVGAVLVGDISSAVKLQKLINS